MIAIGLMSGTSLDGIDAALVEICPTPEGSYMLDLRRFKTVAFEADLERDLRAALAPHAGSVHAVASLHRRLGAAFAQAAANVAGDAHVDYVASHGLTIYHDGASSITLQIGDAFAIRDAVRATVCYDFRSADCAAGGEGAPLVPCVDRLLFAHDDDERVAVNLGGIANLTAMPRGSWSDPSRIAAFDSGPANMAIDELIRRRTGGLRRCDQNGEFARSGRCDEAVLGALRADPYFSQAPPKSTGRERFGGALLDRLATRLDALSIEDAAATLTELTASTVADAIVSVGLDRGRIFLSGGGVHNAHLLARLKARLPNALIETTAAMGVDPDAKEALAFAVLGYETLRGRAVSLAQVTGARTAVVLGAIAPYQLAPLLARMENECRL